MESKWKVAAVSLALAFAGCRSTTPADAPPGVGLPGYLVQLGQPGPVHRDPLLEALDDEQPDRLKSLLDAGGDPNLREGLPASRPLLGLAMRFSYLLVSTYEVRRAMTALLLDHGADPNIRWCGDNDRDGCDEHTGITPLMQSTLR